MPEAAVRKVRHEWLEDGRVLRVLLAGGKGNVLDRQALEELREILREAVSKRRLRALIVDHEGEHFSFGASVEEHLPDEVRGMLTEFHTLARELLLADVPLLAAVRGQCLGGGLELAGLCDRIFAAPGARFGQPELRLGVFAPIGSLLLPRLVGPVHAADLLLTGRSVDAREAERMGLVAEVVDDPSESALAWAGEHLLPKSAEALRFATRAARFSWAGSFLAYLSRLESVYLDELMSTNDAHEGLRAFLEKRKPRWEDGA